MDGVCFQFYDNDITSKNIAKEMPRKRDRTPPRELHTDPPLLRLRTQKFSPGKFFGASTHGIRRHSGFRKYKLVWVTEPPFQSYSGSNW